MTRSLRRRLAGSEESIVVKPHLHVAMVQVYSFFEEDWNWPEGHVLKFRTDQPAERAGADERVLQALAN
jgi:hypothetical protein